VKFPIVMLIAPFEYVKLMGQTGQQWRLNTAFRGLSWQLSRTTFLLLPIFCTLDYLRRKTSVLKTLMGNFFVTFGVVGVAYVTSWPFETLKNLAQSGTPRVGASMTERLKYLGGPKGLMRGVSPGEKMR
jgi:hypothetical protein